MNETPERICEALAWLYGGEWSLSYAPSSVHLIFKNKHGDLVEWMDGAADIQDANNDSWFGVPINDRLAHALAVTAPWEWEGLYFERRLDDEEQTLLVAACLTEHKMGAKTFFKWRIASDDGPNMDMHEDTEDAAKTAARAAYLCWMRGRLAMKGLCNE